ncbi:hypothetical protein B0O99DRAFT_530504, partial [Bisporella sp. PMI_857]
VKRFKKKQLVIDSEQQLAGKVVDENTRNALKQLNQVTPEHFFLINAILTLFKTFLKNEYQRKIVAVNAIIAYCGVKKSFASRRIQRKRLVKNKSPLIFKVEKPDTLSQAIRLIKKEKKPTKCFVCFENPSLTLREKVVLYAISSSLNKHFLKKHVNKLQKEIYIDCYIYSDKLKNRVKLLIYAKRFYRTVSRSFAEKLII